MTTSSGEARSSGDAFPLDAWDYRNSRHVSFVRSQTVKGFLESQHKSVVVAAKGMGKTLLLHKKSELLRSQAGEETAFFPAEELVEKFNGLAVSLGDETAGRLRTVDGWTSIWNTAIAIAVLWRVEPEPFTREVARVARIDHEFGRPIVSRSRRNIGSFVTRLIDQRPNTYENLLASELADRLRAIRLNSYIFIDGVDELLSGHTSEHRREREGRQEGIRSPMIWRGAQLGLLAAIRELQQISRRVRVYASLRIEATDSNDGPLRAQESDYCQILTWNKQQLAQMFVENIEALAPGDLWHPKAQDPYEKFLGLTKIRYRGVAPMSEEEPIFDFIYRHTLGRPRDLMRMGQRLRSLIVGFDDDREGDLMVLRDAIRFTVLDEAQGILSDYKREMVPQWDESFDLTGQSIKTNILSRSRASDGFAPGKRDKNKEIFAYYARRGLIGWARFNDGGNSRIHFVSAARYGEQKPFDVEQLSDWYFLHPCLAESMRSNNANFNVDSRQLVGDGYPATLAHESGVLHLRPSGFGHFYMELDEGERHLRSSVAWATILVALLVVVARERACTVSAAQVQTTLSELCNAKLLGNDTAHDPIANLIAQNFEHQTARGTQLLSSINSALHGLRPGENRTEQASEAAYVRFEEGSFEFVFCEADMVDVQDVLHALRS